MTDITISDGEMAVAVLNMPPLDAPDRDMEIFEERLLAAVRTLRKYGNNPNAVTGATQGA